MTACHAIRAGDGELFVAGGVESMSRAPLVLGKSDRAFPRGNQTAWDTTLGWRFPNPRLEAMFPLESMGETGENVAREYAVTREAQDAFALASQQRHAEALAAGRFDDEIVPVDGVEHDEHPAARHVGGEARLPEAGVSARRQRDGRELEWLERRRGCRRRGQRGEGRVARRPSARRGSSRAPLPESIRG